MCFPQSYFGPNDITVTLAIKMYILYLCQLNEEHGVRVADVNPKENIIIKGCKIAQS